MDDHSVFTLVSNLFYESPEFVAAEPSWVNAVRQVVPPDWQVRRAGIWMDCANPHQRLRLQGFKIHLSCIPGRAQELLGVVAEIAGAEGASFKFLAGPRLLALIDSKTYPRGSSGKFITIYPSGLVHFRDLIETLYKATVDRGFAGPYILSDRRYKDSGVLYYRFGALMGPTKLRVDGTRKPPDLVATSGRAEADMREPFFQLPSWVKDPFGGAHELGEPADPILAGRFKILSILRTSNRGNVYEAQDLHTDAFVVVKEARPFVCPAEADGVSFDCATMVRNEHRILARLAGTGLTPLPIALFDEWEHTFGVATFLPAISLRQFLGSPENLVLPFIERPGVLSDFGVTFARIALGLLDAVQAVHDRGVLIGDLSADNVLVTPADLDVKLIDFESSVIESEQSPVDLLSVRWTTPGHVRPGRFGGSAVLRADDWYAAGMVLFNYVCFVGPFFDLEPKGRDRFLLNFEAIGLPSNIVAAVRALLVHVDPDEAREALLRHQRVWVKP